MAGTRVDPDGGESRREQPASGGLPARRPRSGAAVAITATVIVCGVITAAVALMRLQVPTPRHSLPLTTTVVSPRVPPAARLIATIPVQSNLMAAHGGRLYALGIDAKRATFVRVDPAGTVTRRSAPESLAPYASVVGVQGGSIYAGTDVVAKFTGVRNELVRVNASSLAPGGRTLLPAGVVAIASNAHGIWLALTDDRLLRLDPASLAVRASYLVPGAIPAPFGSSGFGSLTLGPGGLWATFGSARHTTVDRFDPATLSLLDAIRVPEAGQGIRVAASPESLWLVGPGFVRPLEPSGALLPSVPAPGLQGVAVSGTDVLVLRSSGAASETLDVLDANGRVLGRSDVGDAGSRIVLSGGDVWLERGLRIASWRLTASGR